MRKLTSLLLFVFLSLSIYGQDIQPLSGEQIPPLLLKQIELYPQEKIHLHLDRNRYVPGDKIWFKAYLVDAVEHRPLLNSRYVYVELISPQDTLISRVMLRPEEGMFHGHIFLSEIIPEGTYTIVAYTKYMDNPDQDYFFKRPIYIGNIPTKDDLSKKQNIKRRKTSHEDYDVTFYPEGGYLLHGTLCRVAFKALNSSGLAEYVTGEIVDEAGEIISTMKTFHNGMGTFSCIFDKTKKYYVNCINLNGKKKRFELPAAQSGTYSLYANWRNNKLSIDRLMSSDIQQPEVSYLLIHCRGTLLYFATWEKDKKYMSFVEEQLPSGVIHIILFDKEMKPLSERLVFSRNKDQTKLTFDTDKVVYSVREKVTSSIKMTNMSDTALTGNISVSVVDDNDIPVDNHYTILTTLLLTSDLKGHIDSPGYYFEDNKESSIALDHLMMTQGWRRYNIPEVVNDNYATTEKEFEDYKTISGKVKRFVFSRAVKEGDILMMGDDGSFFQTKTDQEGRFTFEGLEYPDSTQFFIQSLTAKGGQAIELDMDKETFPNLSSIASNESYLIVKDEVENESMEKFLEKAQERLKYDEDMRVVNLQSVNIVASRIEKQQSLYTMFSDFSINSEEIEKKSPMYASSLLYGVPGLQVTSEGAVKIRGSLYSPLLIVDGMRFTVNGTIGSTIDMFHPQNIERIDIYKGATAVIFGLGATSGVISITTKNGPSASFEREAYNKGVISPIGYQLPVEFYSPKYETPEEKTTTVPDYRTTIYWKPDIETSDDGEASFEFYTSDFPTTYSVVIEGITDNGKIIRSVEKINVE